MADGYYVTFDHTQCLLDVRCLLNGWQTSHNPASASLGLPVPAKVGLVGVSAAAIMFGVGLYFRQRAAATQASRDTACKTSKLPEEEMRLII